MASQNLHSIQDTSEDTSRWSKMSPQASRAGNVDMNGDCYLLSLPQELQDEIFSLAYGTDNRLLELDDETWAKRSRSPHSCSFYFCSCKPCIKIDQFFISKQCFVQAAKAWVTAYYGQRSYGYLDRRGHELYQASGIVPAFLTQLEHRHNSHLPLPRLPKWPAIRHLIIHVCSDAFNMVNPRNSAASREEVSEEDLLRLAKEDTYWTDLQTWLQPGQTFELRSVHYTFFEDDPVHVLERNVKRLEKVLKAQQQQGSRTVKPRIKQQVSDVSNTPLYHGSKVRWGQSLGLPKSSAQLGDSQSARGSNTLNESRCDDRYYPDSGIVSAKKERRQDMKKCKILA